MGNILNVEIFEDGENKYVLYDDFIKLLERSKELKEENERLSKNQRYYKNGVFCLEYDKETMSDMIDDYKSRIDKTIEYIEENKQLFIFDNLRKDGTFQYTIECDADDLLKILKGEDNEN